MNKTEIMAFIKENPLAFLATVDGNKPHVRGMENYRADENGLIFYSRKNKDVHKQIAKNPEVEICFFNAKTMTEVRVSGRMEMVDDMELKKEIVSKRNFLQPLIDAQGWENMSIYRLKKGKATVWKFAEMTVPKTFEDIL